MIPLKIQEKYLLLFRGSDETNGPSRNKKCKYHTLALITDTNVKSPGWLSSWLQSLWFYLFSYSCFQARIQKRKLQNPWNLLQLESITSGLWREQLNSSWMDSSHVPGSFKYQADHLRTHNGGQLKILHISSPGFKFQIAIDQACH